MWKMIQKYPLINWFVSFFLLSDFLILLLTVTSSVSMFLCILPLILDIPLDNSTHFHPRIYNEMTGLSFKYSLVASIAISIPVSADFLLNAMSSNFVPGYRSGLVFRATILLALIFPDLIIFFAAIPLRFPELLVCMMQLRLIMCAYSVFGHLILFGGHHFRSNLIVLVSFLTFLGQVLISWEAFTTSHLMFYLYLCIQGINLVLFFIVLMRWYEQIRFKSFSQMTTAEASCYIYIVPTTIAVLAYLVIYLYKQGGVDANTSETILTMCTYIEAFFTVSISVLHSRVSEKEVFLQQGKLDQKRMFVRYVSHEIRTPLNTVMIGLDLLQADLKDWLHSESALNTLTDLRESCGIAVEILNDLLNYEKLEAGIMTLDTAVVSASSFIVKAIAPFAILARSKGIKLECPLSVDEVPVELRRVRLCIDESKLNQVVRNIFSNAIKFTPPGGVVAVRMTIKDTPSSLKLKAMDTYSQSYKSMKRLSFSSRPYPPVNPEDLSLGSEKAAQAHFCVEVVDTGAGIAPEDLARLFHEIVQFHPGKLQNGGGSGLGLFISKGIVDLHNGRISVQSEGEGRGCTFAFEIPISCMVDNLDESSARLRNAVETTPREPINAFAIEESNLVAHRSSDMLVEGFGMSDDTARVLEFKSADLERRISVSSLPGHTSRRSTAELVYKEARLSDGPQYKINRRTSSARDLKSSVDRPLHNCARILVVDDAVVNLKFTCRGLHSRGYANITQATDGAIAIEAFARGSAEGRPYDIVLLDYQMPNMDGPTTAKALRDVGFRGKIIGVTGNALKSDIDLFMAHGVDAVLVKPVNMDELDKAIQDILNCGRCEAVVCV